MHLLSPELMRKKLPHPGIKRRENRHGDLFGIAKPAKSNLVTEIVTAEKQAIG